MAGGAGAVGRELGGCIWVPREGVQLPTSSKQTPPPIFENVGEAFLAASRVENSNDMIARNTNATLLQTARVQRTATQSRVITVPSGRR